MVAKKGLWWSTRVPAFEQKTQKLAPICKKTNYTHAKFRFEVTVASYVSRKKLDHSIMEI